MTGEVKDAAELVRFVISPEGQVTPDIAGKLPGRGLWLSASAAAVAEAARGQRFARAARAPAAAGADLAERVGAGLAERCLNYLGLARRSGAAVTGYEKVAAALRGGVIESATTAAVIDEIPILAVLAAASEEGLMIRDAAELRVKETDRIATVADNLQRMGVDVEVFDDGMKIPGRNHFQGAQLDSFGDHRIAMAFTVAALAADGDSALKNAEAASGSFPEFYELLDRVAVG